MEQETMQVETQVSDGPTLAGMFWASVAEHGQLESLKQKRGDKWKTWSYAQLGAQVDQAAHGLMALGLEKQARVAIFAKNCPEWAITDWAALSLGMVTVPIYDTLTAENAEYILQDSQSRVVVVETVDQLNKVRKVRTRLPQLHTVVLIEEVFEKTLSGGEMLFSDFLRRGQEHGASDANAVEQAAAAVKPTDWASIVYTSGTTGPPKGVVLTHGNFASNVMASVEKIDIGPGDVFLSFLPLSHVFERMGGHFRAMHSGATVAYSEGIEMLAANMLEVRPHVMLSVPRLYEKLYSRITEKVAKDSWLKRKIFGWALGVGKNRLHEKYDLKVINPSTEKKFRRADHLVFSKIRDRTGGRLKFFISGGAALSPEIHEFFNAVNIPILQGYGLTETSPVLSANTMQEMRIGSCGKAFPGAELKFADDGEILARGPMIFQEYLNRAEDTKEVLDSDGFFHTGDIGHVDEDGYLFITDRKKELIIMSNGKNVPPQPIEGLLKTQPGIGMAVVIGEKRKYISALISPDGEYLESWAKEHGKPNQSLASLVKDAQVQAMITAGVEKVNEQLPRYEQIKRFHVLGAELSQETGELTPTLKVKRRVVDEKFAERIEALYPTN